MISLVNLLQGGIVVLSCLLTPMKHERPYSFCLEIEVIEYFEAMAQEKGISDQEFVILYLQDCVVNKCELSFE